MNLRTWMALGAATLALAGLTACSDDDSGGSGTTSSSAPESSSSSPTGSTPSCDGDELLAQLPEGSTMDKFACAAAGSEYWAAVQVKEGPTVYFLKWNGSGWDPETSDEVCGTASAGLPQKLLDFCS